MNRRSFLRYSGLASLGWPRTRLFPVAAPGLRSDTQGAGPGENSNWASPKFRPAVKASSYAADPPWEYIPQNVLGDNLFLGWEANREASGAWLEIEFPQMRPISEVWILPEPLPRDIRGQEVYILVYSREQLFESPRRIRIDLSNGLSVRAELRRTGYFQIISLPQTEQASSLRITVEDVWPKAGGQETGLGKILVYAEKHGPEFQIEAGGLYDVRNGQPVQSATAQLINPGAEVQGGELKVSKQGSTLLTIPLQPIPARSASKQDVWIPAPLGDAEMAFEVSSREGEFRCKRSLHVPAYHSYFDGGTFSLNCTCHNDLGWLDTQAKTADFRSAEIILPALALLREDPEFMYSMESTTYLMEFLERHPERREEITAFTRGRRFTWGASYVQCQEVHVGPEKLVRQFYLGRRWLKETFPGVDTHFYVKTDPPSMTLQMPQILAKAGVKYCIQGRMPFGFYNWEAPDGSTILTYAYLYADPMRLLDPKDNEGWLHFAADREAYYASHRLPRMFIYDYTSDYLPPQPALIPYVRAQNEAMTRFAAAWNANFPHDPGRQINPPRMRFTTPEAFLDEFTRQPLDITTLRGDWPFSWAYYDEPANREALLAARLAHNGLLIAERIYAAVSLGQGFTHYPAQAFAEAWKANLWPDHGWGGNHGTQTDSVYHASYARSKTIADQVLSDAGRALVRRVLRTANAGSQVSLVVFNPLSWDRTDVVSCEVPPPSGYSDFSHFRLQDDSGKEVPFECSEPGVPGPATLTFVAHDVPPVGTRTFQLEYAGRPALGNTPVKAGTMDNRFLRVTFGKGGIGSLYDKRQEWEVLRTGKFDGGEVLQFSAPGNAWEDPERVTMEAFDCTSRHNFPFKAAVRSPIRMSAVRQAQFEHFSLRESFHLYDELDRVDIGLEILNWDGTPERELRVVFPINLDEARLSYEAPFGTVEMKKDELDFSLLPPDPFTQFSPEIYGANHPLAYREAINWIDASSPQYLGSGLLAASDITVHLFRDETADPVSCPVLQHVLLSARKSLAWNPDYWFTQPGDHRYRMALFPHGGDWRSRYRQGIEFNYPLTAFAGFAGSARAQAAQSHLRLDPPNLVLTALKKSEDDERIVVRFYEAEGNECRARIGMSKPIRHAWRTSLIEEEQEPLQVLGDGRLEFAVRPWEIVTLMVLA
jgi:alpha-mannosidase